ncbi:MAG: hypothetical protein VB025_09235 [Sphaerochaeta sp.]|nr:hypothetical protein [Sphaerochaeta sp.]
MDQRKQRPGRAIGAERRRVAREDLKAYADTDAWMQIPARIRIAIEELVPEIRKERR